MSARYGDKTRSGDPVSGFGQRTSGGGGATLNVYEQEFLAPGTWTQPSPSVTFVEVLVVGGGMAGGSDPSLIRGGGGGGVGVFHVPVSGPMPVTIGAGGTAPFGGGGTTWFGPSTPPTPNNIARAGGGGSGGLYGGSMYAPPDVLGPSFGPVGFGSQGFTQTGSPGPGFGGGAGGGIGNGWAIGGNNKWGYGGGAPGFCGQGRDTTAPLANTGHGGCTGSTGRAGGSGYCLVRWYAP